jgi:hypothetical protein
MEYYANLEPGLDLGEDGPFGRRVIVEVTGGEFNGSKLNGKFRNLGAADWAIFDRDGLGHLDVRLTMETDDGAMIYLQYFGRLVANEAVTAALTEGADCDWGQTHFFTQPRFETGDPRYKWLNRVVAVSEGRLVGGRVEYKVYQCVND